MIILHLNGADGMATVLGIDPSLSGTAFVVLKDGELHNYCFFTDVIKVAKASPKHAILNKATGIERLNKIYESYDELLAFNSGRIDCVGIENYAFGATSNSVFQIGGCGELLRLLTYREKIPYKEFEPSVVKKFATGNGSAQKSEMVLAAYKDGFDVSPYGKNGEDLADAYWIAKMITRNLQILDDKKYLQVMPAKEREVWNATSKKNPIPLIDRSFIGGA